MADTLEIAPYDPDWPRRFTMERGRIARAFGALAIWIEHHGSTATPDLAAKPMIDVQVSVVGLHPIEAYAPQLGGIGYVHVPNPDVAHEYAALKRDLAPHFSARRHETRQVYAETRGGFIERTTRRALTAESL